MFDNDDFFMFPEGSMHSGCRDILGNNHGSCEDPLAPICDIDSIFSDDQDDAMSSMPIGSLMTFGMINPDCRGQTISNARCTASQLCSWNAQGEDVKPAEIPSDDILSEVLDELDDITQDLRPDEIAALSADLIPPSNFEPTVPAPPSFKHLRPCAKPKRRIVSDESSAESDEQLKRQKVSISSDESDDASAIKFRMYQAEKWDTKFAELVEYKKTYRHCQVPHGYKANPALARWTKRQRYQYKLYQENKASTITENRIAALENLGFVWDSHSALWDERYRELEEFVRVNGHANVPSSYHSNPKLAIWVKCQRRQYKLLVCGEPSNMTYPRVQLLKKLDFVWEIRKTGYLS